jgi:flagellar assembly factor FliW
MSSTAQLAPAISGAQAPETLDATIVFSDGLVGCPGWRRFIVVVDADEDLPVALLRCVDDPGVELMITNPCLIDADYDLQLTSWQRAELGLSQDSDVVVYCTLTVKDGWISANLLGPLVINPETRQGRQLVLADSHYSTRHPVAQVLDVENGA